MSDRFEVGRSVDSSAKAIESTSMSLVKEQLGTINLMRNADTQPAKKYLPSIELVGSNPNASQQPEGKCGGATVGDKPMPTKPEKPSKPVPHKPEGHDPVKPGKPGKPEGHDPVKPGKPGKPEDYEPVKPGKPDKPGGDNRVKPGKPYGYEYDKPIKPYK